MGQYDFSGWATVNDRKCSDGRTIRRDAFKECDGTTVPLVWNHNHEGADNVLGHALLENRPEGVYAYGIFNETEAGQNAKSLVVHGDITSLSIWANKLTERNGDVMHGTIRELSLVLAGANPGAFIDCVMAHGDDEDSYATIYSGEEIVLSHGEEIEDFDGSEDIEDIDLEHADEETIGSVVESMTEIQQNVMLALMGQSYNEGLADGQNSSGDDNNNEDNEEGENEMKHSAFKSGNKERVLSHAEEMDIINGAKKAGSMKESFLEHTATYGIDSVDWLFPDAQTIDNEPGFVKRNPDDWVSVVLSGVGHSPFSRIKSIFADITADDARAKGYIKGSLKKEEVFTLLKRTTTPTTIYKKQKMDRDDVIDITGFDVIAFLKKEMRMMLDEEIARAVLFGDGRLASSDYKISESCVRPVYNDAALYTITVNCQYASTDSDQTIASNLIDSMVLGQNTYQGSGNITAFVDKAVVTNMLLIKNSLGERIYKTTADVAAAMNVDKIVPVPTSVMPSGYAIVALDLRDYKIGADKGGAVSMFDDFDIDYNQQKYLIETRCSGALVKPYSAIAIKKVLATTSA